MFNNAIQFFPQHSLDVLAVAGNALMHRPIAITSAIAAIFAFGIFYPREDLQVPQLNSSLCKQLTDSEWESLPLRDDFNNFKQKVLFSNLTCKSVTEKLLSELTKDFRKLASDMRHADPNALTLELDDVKSKNLAALQGNMIYLSPMLAELWWNEASHQRNLVRGVIAHEIAHSILKHPEKIMMKGFETLGIAVKSPEDLDVVMNAIAKQAQEASYLSIVAYAILKIPFWKPDYFNSSSNESTKKLYADVTSLFQRNASLKFDNVCKEGQCTNYEIEADLLTLRLPEYARGLTNFFKHVVLKCNELYNSTYCDNSSDSEHPPWRQRVTYMTDGLCTKYPGQNQDICQCN